MRFFRGIAVPRNGATAIVDAIRMSGMKTQPGMWQSEHHKPDPALIDIPDLSTKHTRPEGAGIAILYACGNKAGAHHYAWHHNRTQTNDTPIVIEFESDLSNVAVDGRDFLYPVIQRGDPARARPIILSAFGEKGLRYVERAWREEDQDRRIAIGDLMIHDPEVIECHYRSTLPIAGRYNTRYTNAFTVGLPISSISIKEVIVPEQFVALSGEFVGLGDVI